MLEQLKCSKCGRLFPPRPGRGRQPTRCPECIALGSEKPTREGACIDCGRRVIGGVTGSIPKRCEGCKTSFYNRKRQIGERATFNCVDCSRPIEHTRTTGAPPKRCVDCKAIHERVTRQEYVQRYREANPEKVREYSRKAHEKRKLDPVWRQAKRDRHLKEKYGITPAEVQAMRDAQNDLCAICQKTHVGVGSRLHVDHCHNTGKVRALLCGKCNTAIGLLNHDPELVDAAAAYLRGHL